ncbi:Gag protease polyprotein [Hibiscus syriacus]|uniref:Gag protease polyprotein n=1 Tax=Hibiscus syriacus TaxID=106335 RepID=A0A6A3CZ67_HIBSY|nr:uncharacterized protein LOC120120939 [Hibiscus syriacus]KAE8733664.1 Gag protease polyprotein [Hibiscus syriacus]
MLLSSKISSLPCLHSPAPNLPTVLTKSLPPYSRTLTAPRKGSRTPRILIKVSSSLSENLGAVFDIASKPHDQDAAEVVRRFYAGINGRDLASVEPLIAEKCVYEDLIFPHPFTGRKEILEFFKSFMDSISKDLQFAIEDISGEDSSAVGVTWHLEWKGKVFPFSKGCSFYRLEIVDGKRQIVYGRDVVEPAIKPGKTALGAIRAVTWVLQQFPQLADQL